MAFLQHHPNKRSITRQNDQIQQESIQSSSSHLNDATQRSSRGSGSGVEGQGYEDDKDWSIVFPGKSRSSRISTSRGQLQNSTITTTESLPSPFTSSPEEELELDLTMPPAHDGTGRFTRPSSPSYVADDELDQIISTSPESALVWNQGDDIINSLDSVSSDDELDLLEEAEVASSVLVSESESTRLHRRLSSNTTAAVNKQRKGSTSISAQKLQRASQLDQHGSITLASSSWSWMNAAQSQSMSVNNTPRQTIQKPEESWNEVSAVLTSDSEGEEAEEAESSQNAKRVARLRRLKEDAAFEEALASAPLAYSAGLHSRIPKRRHRKNGESEKGSKRSNTSAAVTSELLSANRRRATSNLHSITRKSQASVTTSARSSLRSRSKQQQDPNNLNNTNSQSEPSSRTERLLNAILKRIFNVDDDDDVLQAFLYDRGPLSIDETEKERHTGAAVGSLAPLSFGGQGADDEIWSRNQRQRHMRLLIDGRSVPEEVEEVDSGNEEDFGNGKGKQRSNRQNSQSSSYPSRSYVSKNVSEPSLPEALHATLLSGLRSVPSGLSILLAGSNSVRFVNYLVGRIGPGLTDRMRKLVDEASSTSEETNLDTSTSPSSNDLITRVLRSSSYSGSLSDEMGSWDGIEISSLRFKGDTHPAIASSSNRSTRSSSQSTVPATNL